MGPGKRCKGGYHLRGTVAAIPIPEQTPPNLNVGSNPGSVTSDTSNPSNLQPTIQPQPQPQTGGNVVIDPANLKDFLGKLIREEMAAVMSSSLNLKQQQQQTQPQPPPPQQPQQPPQPQRFQMSQDYRMALIGELLSKH